MSDKKKRLLVTASTFPRWKEDTEPRFILDLSKALTKYYDVTVLAPACPGAATKETLEGVKVLRYHYFPIHKWETLCYPGAIVPRIKEKKIRALLVPFLFLGLWFKLLRILKNYDLAHAHWIIPQGIVESFFKTPYVLTGHGGDVMELNKFPISVFKKRAIKHAKAVSVVSKRLKSKIEREYDAKNVFVQSMGCNTKNFSSEHRINNYFNQGEKKVVLFVGRLVEIKGLQYLMDAIMNTDAILVIVGKGPLENKVVKQAKESEGKIQYLGAKTHHELAIIYASSDIFVLPSITLPGGVAEGMPTVIVEAMASGLPVIATKTGGIPDMIQDGENGFLVDEKSSEEIAEKIQLLIHNNALYERIVKIAQEDGKKKDYENVAENFAEIYKSVD